MTPAREGTGSQDSLFDAVSKAAPRVDAMILATASGQWSFAEILAAAERFADHIARQRTSGLLVVAQVSDAAATAIVALACDLAEVPVVHSDPAAPVVMDGLIVRDAHTHQPEDQAARWGSDRSPALWTHLQGAPVSLASVAPRSQIFLTSGSSGTPLGVVRPAAKVLVDCHRIADFLGYEDGRPVLVSTPAFHSYGFTYGLLAAMLRGAASVHRSPRSLPSQLARTAAQLAPRTLIGLPFTFQLIAKADRDDFPGLRQAVSSGAPLPPDVAAAVAASHAFALHNAYGSSETGAVSLARIHGEPRHGDVGRPLPRIGVRLDTAITAVAADPERDAGGGELLLSTDSLASGYLGPNGLLPLAVEGEWYRTGDLADVRDGQLRLLGRVSDVINVAGEKVRPIEIERVLLEHPLVREAQVFASPDATRGQIPVARVVASGALAEEDVLRWCRQHLAPHQLPRRIDFLDELPRSATGKRIKGLAT
ncbi:fatty acid--CoA ligase family protein [Streptomyces polygonati]|uniref:Fatty acid--CoA ligase family protein n=1 Tax=Streptomyces polygonati TaxID=1617087 RepID=A0ABV8HTH5_9ACTN